MSTVTVTTPVRRRPVFHALTVDAVDRLTDDAVAVCFQVPVALREAFAFRPGQHLTVRRVEGSQDVRRSYSISSTPDELTMRGWLRIGVKHLPGGTFSDFATHQLGPGDVIEVLPPLGHFTTDLDPARSRHYAAIVAGSGVTPVLSLIASALAVEAGSRFTLLFGNRYARSVMFAEELADLKDRYPTRLQIVHVLSREPQEAALLSGRIDANRLDALLDAFIAVPPGADEWFLCGPYRMVLDAREVLARREVPDSAVHTELFHVDQAPGEPVRITPAQPVDSAATVQVSILLDGRTSTFTMRHDERVLDAALRVRSELPYACKGGVCSTCRARVIAGEVAMVRNYALEPDELAAGYVLTCQSTPVTDAVAIDYDA